MKKIIILLIIAAVLISFPVSAGKTDAGNPDFSNKAVQAVETVKGTVNATEDALTGSSKQAAKPASALINAQGQKNKSAGQGIVEKLISNNKNQEEIKAQIILKKKEFANQSQLLSDNKLKNQNTVRLAVHTLLAAGNISGGIGDQISQIAKEFNNSIRSTNNAEEKIQNRDGISKFFFGGDSEAAAEILKQIEMNRERIENLNVLMNQCDCDEELKAMIQEQIALLEQEQNRLQGLSETELKNKGLFGGLFG